MAKPCKHCQSEAHASTFCFQAPKKPIKSVSKAIKGKKRSTTRPKTETRSKLVKKLDTIFSQYIRLSESGNDGYGICITCGEKKFWKEAQACHFFTRGRQATRWDEDNVHFGCYRCNVLLKGNYINYTRYMLDSYSREFVEQLEYRSLNGDKITTPQLRDMIQHYITEVDELKSKKCLY